MTDLTAEALDALEAMEKTATPGLWRVAEHNPTFVKTVYRDEQGNRVTAWPAQCECGAQPNEANAALIVALRNAAPALIAAARREAEARKRIAELEQALRPFAVEAKRYASNAWEDDDLLSDHDGLTVADFRRAARLLTEQKP